MLPDVDQRLLGNQVVVDGTTIHRRVDLLAVGHHRVARERVVVLPARQLADAANLAVNGAQQWTKRGAHLLLQTRTTRA